MPHECHGVLVIDKPPGITSRDAVNRAQRWFPAGTRIGHTGTLDPLATGVLVLCIGSATRLAEYVQRMRKTYRASLILGARSDSDDADGVITPVDGATRPEEDAVRKAVAFFEGEQDQIPPAFSASKIAGRRAYKMARQGLDVPLQPRRIVIYRVAVLSYRFPHLELEIECGKGTYIRALARDLGNRLGCGAYVATLRRTRVGIFTTESALSLETPATTAVAGLLPIEQAVSELPRATLTPEATARLRQGQSLEPEAVVTEGLPLSETDYAAFDPAGPLVGIVSLSTEAIRWRPVKVLQAK